MKLRIAKKILRREHRETKAQRSPFFPLFGLGPYSLHQIQRAKSRVEKAFGKPRITMDPPPLALPGCVRDIDGRQVIRNLGVLQKNLRRFRGVGRMLSGVPVQVKSLPAGEWKQPLLEITS